MLCKINSGVSSAAAPGNRTTPLWYMYTVESNNIVRSSTLHAKQGSGNFEIWISPADDDDVINESISKKKNMCISPFTKTNDNWQSHNSF